MAASRAPLTWRDDPARVRPMLATVMESAASEADLVDPALLYEPKLDGIRALILLEPAEPSARVTIWSRLGNDKTAQFPEVVRGLKDFGKRLRKPVLLDGEIVALDAHGEPAGFQKLQGRMHLTAARDIARQADAQAAAFIAFDVLRDGAEDLRPLPLADRKARLERVFGTSGSSTVRQGEFAAGDGRRLYQQAHARGWEGLIVKVADSPYETGRRSRAWRKLKLLRQQEFVIGGWTEPRETRQYFGALLLGLFEPGGTRLRYIGHSGTGFTNQELARVYKLLQARATNVCPFTTRPASNERPHWVRPELVAQVRFSEWTHERLLRHPVYLGLRDDVDPKRVTVASMESVEPIASVASADAIRDRSERASARASAGASARQSERASTRESELANSGSDRDATADRDARSDRHVRPNRDATSDRSATASDRDAASDRSTTASDHPDPVRRSPAGGAFVAAEAAATRRPSRSTSGASTGTRKPASASASASKPLSSSLSPSSSSSRGARGRIASTAAEERALLLVVDQLRALEDARRDGTIALPNGTTLDVTNLSKVFWPAEKLTKGDLMRFYVRVSPWLLPAVEDRPLVMKRYPNGINAKAFYQQRAPDDVPPGVRVELVEDDSEESGVMPRLVGGSITTLLYMVQLATISQDPWFSRVQSPEYADYVALDLDPMPGVPFTQVLDVARWVHEELEALHIPGVPKTSGSSGLHVYIPLPPRTTYESGQLLCHIVATMVAMKHGRVATVERAVAKRGRKVYVDYLQNIQGKTLATAYGVKWSEFAGVSTPLTWDEVHAGLEPQDFTLRTALARFEQVGDLWAPIRTARPVDLRGTLERLAASSS